MLGAKTRTIILMENSLSISDPLYTVQLVLLLEMPGFAWVLLSKYIYILSKSKHINITCNFAVMQNMRMRSLNVLMSDLHFCTASYFTLSCSISLRDVPKISAIILVWWMAQPEAKPSGVYLLHWLWQMIKPHTGRCVWFRCTCQVGWQPCLCSFKCTPYLHLLLPLMRQKHFPCLYDLPLKK